MTELEKIQHAKVYIDYLANGINPLDSMPASDSDVINNVRISRCLFYVSDILRQVLDNKGIKGKTKTPKKPFFLSADSIEKFTLSDRSISISEITRRLNDLADLDVCNKLKYSDITEWLSEVGILKIKITADGKSRKIPTEQGRELGISEERRIGRTGEYTGVFYNKEAQQFILDNLGAVIYHINCKHDAK